MHGGGVAFAIYEEGQPSLMTLVATATVCFAVCCRVCAAQTYWNLKYNSKYMWLYTYVHVSYMVCKHPAAQARQARQARARIYTRTQTQARARGLDVLCSVAYTAYIASGDAIHAL